MSGLLYGRQSRIDIMRLEDKMSKIKRAFEYLCGGLFVTTLVFGFASMIDYMLIFFGDAGHGNSAGYMLFLFACMLLPFCIFECYLNDWIDDNGHILVKPGVLLGFAIMMGIVVFGILWFIGGLR